MRLTERFGTRSPSVRSRWAAGSVVERWTLCPTWASSRAIVVAMVVLPTPPLPIVRITPWPIRVISGINSSSDSGRESNSSCETADIGCSATSVGSFNARRAETPMSPKGRSPTSTRGSVERPTGIASSAERPRASRAAATPSDGSIARNRPLMINRWFRTPRSASSRLVRSASCKAVASARVTSTRVVVSGSESAARADS